MNADVVVRVQGLGKKYVIGHESERVHGGTLRDVIARAGKGFARKLMETASGRALVVGDTTEEFWALKDVSFEVKRGEVIGIIGRNGAGKSTLLKILSRITDPSEGRVTIHGRVASLLEVGTGFHPELTGRENIFLNGAILGMSREEIRRKFDEIVAFSGVERFIDTPVKRYSSGMYVRLAFAVAAHLEPEILIVDEVLAVGDLEFQKKCLGKMSEVATGGRTVLFVSHNLASLQSVCERGILLNQGRIAVDGELAEAISRYLPQSVDSAIPIGDLADRMGNGVARVAAFRAFQQTKISDISKVAPRVTAEIRFVCQRHGMKLRLMIGIYDRNLTRIVMLDTQKMSGLPLVFPRTGTLTVELDPSIALFPGRYSVNIALYADEVLADYLQNVAAFDVEKFDFYGDGDISNAPAQVLVKQCWKLIAAPDE